MGLGESRMEGFPEPVRHLVLVLYTPDIHDRSNNDSSVIPRCPISRRLCLIRTKLATASRLVGEP
jgi:hypothetical protein